MLVQGLNLKPTKIFFYMSEVFLPLFRSQFKKCCQLPCTIDYKSSQPLSSCQNCAHLRLAHPLSPLHVLHLDWVPSKRPPRVLLSGVCRTLLREGTMQSGPLWPTDSPPPRRPSATCPVRCPRASATNRNQKCY